ncbi:MAG: DUF3990 domain-containing protein [Azoarcus sp.]|jgi:hypothetical protein|nr:DUF3990 domain-containing protein [Azoarcus sp.]
MMLFHGGTDVVEKPSIVRSVAGRDFGPGFYLTGIQEQAEKWARRQARIRKKAAILNVYLFDEQAMRANLRIRKFENYSLEWLELVLSCRSQPEFRHDCDIVFGRIADDDVGETVQAVMDGLMPKDFALQKLSYMTSNEQYCFCTKAALDCLRYREARRLD